MNEGVLNLDALATSTITIEKTVEGALWRWELRDNVSSGVMLWGMALSDLVERLAEAAKSDDAAAIRAVQGELESRTLYLATEIFRNTYPEMSDAEVARLFTHDERMAIAQRFIGHRSSESSAQPNGGVPSATQPTQPTPGMSGNRAQRRRRKQHRPA